VKRGMNGKMDDRNGTGIDPGLNQNGSKGLQDSVDLLKPSTTSTFDPNISQTQFDSTSVQVLPTADHVAMTTDSRTASSSRPDFVLRSYRSGKSVRSSRRGEFSVFVGSLDAYMDETFLRNAVKSEGWSDHVQDIDVVRDVSTGKHEGYGFFRVSSLTAAKSIVQYGNGMPISNSNRSWHLKVGIVSPRTEANDAAKTQEIVHVGNLDSAVTDYELLTLFRLHFLSARSARVFCDEVGQSKGFGSVYFSSISDAQRAVSVLNGSLLRSRKIYVAIRNRWADKKDATSNDKANVSLFIGGIASDVDQAKLYQVFSKYGTVEAVTQKSGFAFVQFASRTVAESVMLELNFTIVPELNPFRAIRVEWTDKQTKKVGLMNARKGYLVLENVHGMTDQEIERELEKYGKCSVVRIAIVGCKEDEAAENMVKEVNENEKNGLKLLVLPNQHIVQTLNSIPSVFPRGNASMTRTASRRILQPIGSSMHKRDFTSRSNLRQLAVGKSDGVAGNRLILRSCVGEVSAESVAKRFLRFARFVARK